MEFKTVLLEGENVIVCVPATCLFSVGSKSGMMIVTNKRLIWEKSGIINVLAYGVLSVLGTDYLSFGLSDINGVEKYYSVLRGTNGGTGMSFRVPVNGLWKTYKFAIYGKNAADMCEKIISYLANNKGATIEINSDVDEISKREIFFCSQCGNRLSTEDRFCKKCGAKIRKDLLD